MGGYRAGLFQTAQQVSPCDGDSRSHLPSISIFHNETETVVGLKGILQRLRVEKNHAIFITHM